MSHSLIKIKIIVHSPRVNFICFNVLFWWVSHRSAFQNIETLVSISFRDQNSPRNSTKTAKRPHSWLKSEKKLRKYLIPKGLDLFHLWWETLKVQFWIWKPSGYFTVYISSECNRICFSLSVFWPNLPSELTPTMELPTSTPLLENSLRKWKYCE